MPGKSASLVERVARLEAMLARIQAALNFVPTPPQDELDAILHEDILRGMSLRECARAHGVKVGRVRGAIARLASQEKPNG